MHEQMRTQAGESGAEAALLAPIAEINEQLLQGLRAQALEPSPGAPRLLVLLQSQWAALDDAALTRLAGCPYLLLDAGFARVERWERLPALSVGDAGRGGYFNGRAGVALVRRALLFAWHLARSQRAAARMAVGLSWASAERLARWRLSDLEALAELAPAWIAPRWEEQPLVWQQLMRAARRDDAAALRSLQLRGLQLLAGASLVAVRR